MLIFDVGYIILLSQQQSYVNVIFTHCILALTLDVYINH